MKPKKQKEGVSELVPVVIGFDYEPLEAAVAKKVRAFVESIRERVKKTVEDIIDIGNDLLAVKEFLPHGQFGKWLGAEFGWGERQAENYMNVAQQFGSKTEIISDLRIQPTAAYLLSAPSVSDEAREQAFERAEAGEKITTKVAKEIVAETRKKEVKKPKQAATENLGPQLAKVLDSYRERWNPKNLKEFARQLREFADALDEHKGDKKAKAKE